ncbi:MAG: hypothetical protein IJE89_05745 [Bacilli bacterium]|nr:hypothetical protein [Bacilli bacterium]
MIELTQKEYEKYRKKGIRTNEGYIFPNPKDKKKIIKVIEPVPTIPKYLEIKKHTIELLLENKDYFGKLNIAYPCEPVTIDTEQRAYVANKIKGIELSRAVIDPNITLETKISYFKQVGTLLRQMGELRRKYPHLANFYYNDIHENNFLVTLNDIVYGIDLDSCRIGDNIPICGMYPTSLPKIKRLDQKYKKCIQVCENSTEYIPDKNIDLYSYIIMILNFMYGSPFTRWSPEKLDKYLNYLESKGANLELLYALSYVFDESKDNINPDYLLDYIKEIYQYSSVRYDEEGNLRRILR